MTERHISSSRGTTCYWISRREGAGTRNLVFLHGLTADHRLFQAQLEHFAPTHTVLAWDAPAHGRSRPYGQFSYAHLAEELKTILDGEGLERAVLVGQSMGGFVAQSFLARYPSMAEGFVAISSCPCHPRYYSSADLWWLRQIEWMARLFPDRLLRASMARMCGATPQAREDMLAMLGAYSKQELCRLMYLGFAAIVPELRSPDIPCPVCLILGDRDRTGKVRHYNELWHRDTGYPLHIIPNAAHNANADAPAQVNAIIEDFLAGLGDTSFQPTRRNPHDHIISAH